MALSDCSRCWDTPCTCGLHGYVIVYASQEHHDRLAQMSREKFKALEARLHEALARELDAEG